MARPAPTNLIAPCACFRARGMARAVTALYDSTIGESGIRANQLAILAGIRAHGAVSMRTLAAELGIDPSTMTRTLSPMEREGFVASEAGEDRRVRELVLTAKGHRKLGEAEKLWAKAQKTLRDKLGKERFQRLLDDMAEVMTILRDQEPAPE